MSTSNQSMSSGNQEKGVAYDLARLRRELTAHRTKLVYKAETQSTMDDAVAFGLESAVVLTDHQTAGRGRYARTWHDAPGSSILMTLVKKVPIEALPPPGSLLLSHMFCLSVTRALRDVVPGLAVQIRWPNDLTIHDRKLGGVLLAEGERDETYQAILFGVGINVITTAVDDLKLRSSPPIGLSEFVSNAVIRDDIVIAINEELDSVLPDITRIGDPLTDRHYDELWQRASSLLNRRVRISGLGTNANEILEGRVHATPFGGPLQLKLSGGAIIDMTEYGRRASLEILPE